MISIHLKEIIQEALKEDIGMGDLTSESIFPSAHKSKGTFIAKSEGVIAGLEALSIIYNFLFSDDTFKLLTEINLDFIKIYF